MEKVDFIDLAVTFVALYSSWRIYEYASARKVRKPSRFEHIAYFNKDHRNLEK